MLENMHLLLTVQEVQFQCTSTNLWDFRLIWLIYILLHSQARKVQAIIAASITFVFCNVGIVFFSSFLNFFTLLIQNTKHISVYQWHYMQLCPCWNSKISTNSFLLHQILEKSHFANNWIKWPLMWSSVERTRQFLSLFQTSFDFTVQGQRH